MATPDRDARLTVTNGVGVESLRGRRNEPAPEPQRLYGGAGSVGRGIPWSGVGAMAGSATTGTPPPSSGRDPIRRRRPSGEPVPLPKQPLAGSGKVWIAIAALLASVFGLLSLRSEFFLSEIRFDRKQHLAQSPLVSIKRLVIFPWNRRHRVRQLGPARPVAAAHSRRVTRSPAPSAIASCCRTPPCI